MARIEGAPQAACASTYTFRTGANHTIHICPSTKTGASEKTQYQIFKLNATGPNIFTCWSLPTHAPDVLLL